MWSKATAQRKKFVQLLAVKPMTKQKLDVAVQKTHAGRVVGKFGESHRLFVFSCDLVREEGSKPWKQPSELHKSDYEGVLEYLGQVAGPADIVIVFDGRCRAMRRVIEDALTKGGVSPEELWITYKAPPKGDAGKGNEVFMGADSHELAYVRLPQSRQRMKAKPRKDFCLDGASTAHCKTFVNVGLPSKARLPRISRAEKPLAFGG